MKKIILTQPPSRISGHIGLGGLMAVGLQLVLCACSPSPTTTANTSAKPDPLETKSQPQEAPPQPAPKAPAPPINDGFAKELLLVSYSQIGDAGQATLLNTRSGEKMTVRKEPNAEGVALVGSAREGMAISVTVRKGDSVATLPLVNPSSAPQQVSSQPPGAPTPSERAVLQSPMDAAGAQYNTKPAVSMRMPADLMAEQPQIKGSPVIPMPKPTRTADTDPNMSRSQSSPVIPMPPSR